MVSRVQMLRHASPIRLLVACIAVIGLFGCGPAIAPENLPPLLPLDVSDYQDAVREQVSAAYDLVKKKPTNSKANGQLGMLYRAYRDYEAAEIAFGRARLLAPKNADWMYYHGEVLEHLGNYPEAIKAMQSVIGVEPNDIPAQLRLAELQLQSGEVETAAVQLQKMVKVIPNYSGIHIALARVYELNGDLESAIEAWQSAFEFGGEFGRGHYALAQIYRRLGRSKDADRHLVRFNQAGNALPGRLDPRIEKAVKLSVSDRPLILAAQSAKAGGNHRKALELLEQAIERNPANLETRASLVGAYAVAGKYEDAERHYEQGVAIDEDHLELNYSLGRLRQQQGRTSEAIEVLSMVTKQAPKHSLARAWLGRAQELSGKIDAAGASYALAVETEPKNRTARRFFTEWLLEFGVTADAIDSLNKMARVASPDLAMIYSALATLHYKNDNNEAAIEALDSGIEVAELYGQAKLSSRMQHQRASLINARKSR